MLGSVSMLAIPQKNPTTSVAVQIDSSLLASLPKHTNSTIDLAHVAKGLVPPTNHWFSGIALNKDPKAVFPLPLSFKPSGSNFSFGLPIVTATTNTITGGYNPAVVSGLDADRYLVSRYDSLSVTLQYQKAGADVGKLTVAEGTPFLSYEADRPQKLALPGFTAQSGGVYVKTIAKQQYAFVAPKVAYDGGSLQLQKGSNIVLYAVATGTTAADMASYAQPLTSVDVSYADGSAIKTQLRYNTKGGNGLYVALPGQNVTAAKAAGTYETIYGTLQLYKSAAISFSTPKIAPSDTLPLTRLTQSDKDTLKAQLVSDVANTNLQKTDSYFGGKELYRAANLYALANQLGQKDQAKTLRSALETDLSQWFDAKGSSVRDNRYFAYDTTAKGLVGVEASFGADQFNDHHFHYGYFLYTMAIMAHYDQSFANKYEPFVRLLAYDIAAPTSSASFPKLRVFDPYFGHSWASGYGQFDDGNNQESSSEAVNAWNGLALWAQARGDTALSAQASWQLSREFASAGQQWTAIDTSSNAFKGFNHQTVGINWGGKRDYATFFSAEPAAIFGIQLIPMNPAMSSVATQANRITSNLSTTVPDGNYDRQFGDYLLMYRALRDKSGALADAQKLADTHIDDANSRTYLLAWILSR